MNTAPNAAEIMPPDMRLVIINATVRKSKSR
jgi:hypothetical protein